MSARIYSWNGSTDARMDIVERSGDVTKQFVDLLDRNRWGQLERWDRYHRGEFEPPYLPSVNHNAIAQEYSDLLSRSDLPICALVVSAVVDRCQVEGFRSPDSGLIDDSVWSWWQSSHMDSRQDLVYTDSMVFGDGFVAVTPDGEMPKFTVESPLNVVAQYDPADPTKVELAAKLVRDRGWLYAPEGIYALKRNRDAVKGWDVISFVENPSGETPLVRFGNRMDSRGRTQSEISLIAGPQRRIIQTIADRLMVQRAASWRQRWISGIEIETDENGNPIPPFRVGVDQLVVAENPDTKFGEWSESPFDAHLRAVEDDIRQAAAISQTPPHLLAPHTISNISAEALVALEAGLTAKVQERQLVWGEAWERVIRIGGSMVGYDVDDASEVVWADLERRSDAQKVDGAMKLRSMGLPMPFILERLGLSPMSIERVMDEMKAEQRRSAEQSAAAFGLAPGSAPFGTQPGGDAQVEMSGDGGNGF